VTVVRKLLVLVVVLTLWGAAACSDDGGSPSASGVTGGGAAPVGVAGAEKDAAAPVEAALTENTLVPADATDRQKNCVSTRLIKQYGATKALALAQASTVSGDEARQIYLTLDACVDIKASLAAILMADGELSEKSARCLVDKLTPAALEASMVADLSGQDPNSDLASTMLKNRAACLNAEEQSRMN
jgi:hypothetical protein